MADANTRIFTSASSEPRRLYHPILFQPVIFDPPPDSAENGIIPDFCHLGAKVEVPDASSDTSVVDVTAPPVPAREQKQVRSSQEGDLSASVSPEKTLALLRGMMAQAPSEEPPKRERKRSTPYEVAQELMARLPMRLVGEHFYIYRQRSYVAVTVAQLNRQIMAVCRQDVEDSGSAQLIKEVEKILQAEGGLESADTDRQYISFTNGLLNLSSGQLIQHTPRIFSTAQIEAAYIPGLVGQHPVFSWFLSQVSGGDAVLERRIWQAMGYILVPDTDAKVFFLLQGVPNSGKSLLGELLTRLFPADLVTSLSLNDLGTHFGPSDLVGKALCTCMDLPGAPWENRAVGMLKALTGNDLVSADVKYQDRVKFRNSATFLFGTNHVVSLTQPDPAFLQRLVAIPFKYSVPRERQDRRLLDKLLHERDAIVASAMNAYWELRHNNYIFAGDYALNEVVTHDPAVSISLTQAVAEFFYTHCSLDPERETFTSDLYEVFDRLFPGVATYEAFAARFSNFVLGTYPDRVTKRRTRRPGEVNPTSVLVGIRLRDEPGIVP